MLHFFDSHGALAAWVQAFGSILIIGATAAIAMWQSHETLNRERQLQREARNRESEA